MLPGSGSILPSINNTLHRSIRLMGKSGATVDYAKGKLEMGPCFPTFYNNSIDCTALSNDVLYFWIVY